MSSEGFHPPQRKWSPLKAHSLVSYESFPLIESPNKGRLIAVKALKLIWMLLNGYQLWV